MWSRAARRLCLLGVAALCACTSARSVTPASAPQHAAPQPSLALLLDVSSDHEADAVVVVEGGEWLFPMKAGRALLEQIVRPGTSYVLLPSLSSDPPTQAGHGELSGELREHCYDFYLGLAKPAPAIAFGVVNTLAAPRPTQVESLAVQAEHAAVVGRIVEEVAKVRVAPIVQRVYRADLDGDDRPETLVQAAHPELEGEIVSYKPDYYSLLVVLPEGAATKPAFWGYIQGSPDLGGFRVLSLDAIADLDLDDKPELLLRVRHAEGWQTRVFRFDSSKGLVELFNSVGGEADCPEADD